MNKNQNLILKILFLVNKNRNVKSEFRFKPDYEPDFNHYIWKTWEQEDPYIFNFIDFEHTILV